MAKFYGQIGYAEEVESPLGSGIYIYEITERNAFGDILQNTRQTQEADKLNDNISLNNRISIVADAYSSTHYFAIRYVRWAGGYWKVSSVSEERPRLVLSLGEVYNGQTAE